MDLRLKEEFSKTEIIADVTAFKKQIDELRPLPEDIEGKIMQKLRLDWNYHSNAIEGNKLNYGETVAFLMEGITAKGKPLKDHLDIRGHNEAINYLLELIKDSTRSISEADIRTLHKMILVEPYDSPAKTADGLSTTKRINLGEYKTSPNHVKTTTGEIHYYATPEETPAKMQELMDWYNAATNDKAIHPAVTAALFHHKFVSIHPFDDGNGRLSRILMNLVLMQNGYPPVVIRLDDRANYYALLSRADNNDSWPFVEYIAQLLMGSFSIYLKAVRGVEIDEEDDIDKEIALFKMEVTNKVDVKQRRSSTLLNNIFATDINPLIDKLKNKAQQFSDLFFEYSHYIKFRLKNTSVFQYSSIDEFINTTTGTQQEATIEALDIIGIIFQFSEFKNSSNDFNVESWLNIEIEKYSYSFWGFNNELIVEKLYHEHLNQHDQKKIILSLINNIQNQISDNQKSPEN